MKGKGTTIELNVKFVIEFISHFKGKFINDNM
jgi:hypothetical protein